MVFDLSHFWWKFSHSLEAWRKVVRLKEGLPNGRFAPLARKSAADLRALSIGFSVKPVADGFIANV